MKGKVFLVGTGPGDPELLTVKALKILRAAEAVVHDELVSAEVLALIPASARVHSMGKESAQEEIHRLLVTHASEGLRVVRLAGGDPLIFGRVGEEMEALRSTGIDFEVIPGIATASAAAALAGIPLTDRRHASKLIFFSNQGSTVKGSGRDSDNALLDATIVVQLAGSNFESLAAKLRGAGLPDKTPCLVVFRAAGPGGRFHRTTLSELASELANSTQSPEGGLLIVGAVTGTGAGASGPETEFQLKGETLRSLAEARTAVAAS